MTNREKFASKLAELFASVKPAFLADEIRRLRDQADRQVIAWGERLKGEPNRRDWRANREGQLVAFVPYTLDTGVRHLWDMLPGSDAPNLGLGEYGDPVPADIQGHLMLDHPLRARWQAGKYRPSDGAEKWQLLRDCYAADLYTANHGLAEKLAKEYVDQAEAHFVAKQSKKLASAAGDREITKLDGDLALRGIVTGHLTVTVKGGDSFKVDMDIITNYRYGSNSANGSMTVYPQFPARYKDVRMGGKVAKKSAGEKWMTTTFAVVGA